MTSPPHSLADHPEFKPAFDFCTRVLAGHNQPEMLYERLFHAHRQSLIDKIITVIMNVLFSPVFLVANICMFFWPERPRMSQPCSLNVIYKNPAKTHADNDHQSIGFGCVKYLHFIYDYFVRYYLGYFIFTRIA